MNLELVVTLNSGRIDTYTITEVKEYYIAGNTHKMQPDWWEEVVVQLKKHRLVNAIKEYRCVTGAGLKESKAAVESVRDSLLRDGIITPNPTNYI